MSSREKSHHRRHSSPCNSDHSDHSDHSNYSDEIELYSNKHKRDKDLKIEITSRCHSRSSDSSSSRSSSPSSNCERKCKNHFFYIYQSSGHDRFCSDVCSNRRTLC